MYNYELINNHIVVQIGYLKFLLDTGSENSFWIQSPIESICIDGNEYSLKSGYRLDANQIFECIGTKVDGFIGNDIVSKTSLTIYRDGRIDFKVNPLEGNKVDFVFNHHIFIDVISQGIAGQCVIDTGAKIGYGVSELFEHEMPFTQISDYSPIWGRIAGDFYQVNLSINGQSRVVDLANSHVVERVLNGVNAIMIISIMSLFDEACVIDFNKECITLD